MAKDSRPLNKSKENNTYFTDEDFLDIPVIPDIEATADASSLESFDACSSQDCTGLISHGSIHEKSLDAYKDIYDFGSPK